MNSRDLALTNGYIAIVLHAHLPFVRHPEYPDFLEEDWLFEAITETYIPLLITLNSLIKDGIDFRITISMSSPLCEMLSNALLKDRYSAKLQELIRLSESELERHKNDDFYDVAKMYNSFFHNVYDVYENDFNRDIISAFRGLQDAGRVEIITSSATHAILPFIISKSALKAQIIVAVSNYEKYFGRKPKGIWLPECGYFEGLEELLVENGIQYFFIDAHGILNASPTPLYQTFSPIRTPAGVVAFGRDIESSKQVWSAKDGYPGDYNYREFYRDIGYDADYDYIKPFLHSDGIRRNVGIKHFRITGNVSLNEKQIYNPIAATNRASMHASNFIFNRQHQLKHISSTFNMQDMKPIVVAPYDAELFGHWWFEGPTFLDFLFRELSCGQNEVSTITPSEYISKYGNLPISTPSTSSWGDKGYFEVWLNSKNDWIYRHLHKAEEQMIMLANTYKSTNGGSLIIRALNQCSRELLLSQSSDWAFIMTTGTAPAYAHKRFSEHIHRFTKLYEQIISNNIDEKFLSEIESKDTIFQEIDYRVFCS